jgi:hypothetical protein
VKVIELDKSHPTLDDVIGAAKNELVVLRRDDGTTYALASVDEFSVETELLKNNPEFLAYLNERSREKGVISLEELRRELAS